MRKCLRCGAEMVEDWKMVDGFFAEDVIKLERKVKKSLFGGESKTCFLDVAICPKCGEAVFYVKNPEMWL